tara:strand:- start:2780 stop:3484 length:705 start_codon:yes stop_codon:yes gene_type:complete
MTRIKALLFDKDGTLFDFATTWETWAEAFLMRACSGDRDRAGKVGRTVGFDLKNRQFAKDSVVIAGTPGEVTQALLPHFPEMTAAALDRLLNDEAEAAPQAQAVPLAPLLTDFRGRGLHLGVATNDAERPARAHLHQADITGFFDFIAGYDSGHGAKPAPGQMLAFADQIGIPTGQIAMIGDSTHDLRAGRAAGMVCVGVLTGMADHATLDPFADVVLTDIGHLPDWLDSRSRV